MKKSLLFIGMFVLTLVFSSFVFSCDSSQVIFSLYSENNSHIGSFDNLNYNVKACYSLFSQSAYSGESSRVCGDKDVIFYKASEENSHVSLTQSDVYTLPVCYGDLVCENRTNCLEGEEVLARISSLTNAHVSLGDSDSNYPIKICCKKGSPDYISSVSLAKWIDYSSGEEVIEVSNGTKVNISFEGEFQEGELFNYRIYVRKKILNLFPTTEEISSGSGSVKAGSFSSISFDAIWNENYLIGEKTVYFFKIIGKDGAVLNESGDLFVSSSTDLSPAITQITSPKNGEVYLIGDSVNLSWGVVSGNLPVQNITYYSYGANINGTGKDSFSVAGSQEELLSLPLFLNYSSSGQKEIVLTTIDSMGNPSNSRVLISVPGEGVNIFALINKPRNEEKVFVEGISNHLVRFNSSESFVYNSSNGQLTCLAGKCPEKTSGNPSKNINSSSLNDNEKALRVQELYFNWTWKNDNEFSIYGNGTSFAIVAPEKDCNLGEDVVSLGLSYNGVSQKISNVYTVFYTGKYCWDAFVVQGGASSGNCFDEAVGDCCGEVGSCSSDGSLCIQIIQGLGESSKTVCADFNSSEEECESLSPAKGPIANRTIGNCGERILQNGASYTIVSNCTCSWEVEGAENICSSTWTPISVNLPNPCREGICSITSTTTGSCNDGGSVVMDSVASWIWTAGSVGSESCGYQNSCSISSKRSTLSCPVRVQLSFFGIIEFVVAIILIALIYFVIRDLLSKRKFSQEKSKTKKVSKKKVKRNKK